MKFRILILAVCLSMLVGCAPAKESDDAIVAEPKESPIISDEVSELRERIEHYGNVIGVIYLGYYEGSPFDEEFYEIETVSNQIAEYPFIKNIPEDEFVKNDGAEIYCIVPADLDADVKVFNVNMETSEIGNILYEGDGSPFILQGNISDIMPNISISVKDTKGNELENYQPFLSLNDGMLGVPDELDGKIMDLTMYEEIYNENINTDEAVG